MTRGALIFAFDNEVTDYVAMACWSAQNIRRHLGIPVAVVTDDPMAQGFDQVIYLYPEGNNKRHFSDYDATVTWHNESRASVYDLTPWDHTLLLDADYIVASDQLQSVLDSTEDFMCHRTAYDVTGLQTFDDLNVFQCASQLTIYRSGIFNLFDWVQFNSQIWKTIITPFNKNMLGDQEKIQLARDSRSSINVDNKIPRHYSLNTIFSTLFCGTYIIPSCGILHETIVDLIQ
jgi:hypothetical protein